MRCEFPVLNGLMLYCAVVDQKVHWLTATWWKEASVNLLLILILYLADQTLTNALGGHCCLQVESLRILLAVETPFREGLDDEEDRRSALALLFKETPSVPLTQTGLATAGL